MLLFFTDASFPRCRIDGIPVQAASMMLSNSPKNVSFLLLSLFLGIPWTTEAFQVKAPVPVAFQSLLWRNPTVFRAIDTAPLDASQSEVSATSSKRSLLETIDNAGLSFKNKAVQADEKIQSAATKWKKFLFRLKTCVLYALFIVYRGARGFVAVLPTVTRHVYAKLEGAVESPFEVDADDKDGKLPWETRVTTSLLAGILTASYVLRGAIRVTKKLVSAVVQTTNITEAFALAAQEQEENENMILRMAGTINGEEKSKKFLSP
jgi:hypothetical protein